jgi:hypothetical protein
MSKKIIVKQLADNRVPHMDWMLHEDSFFFFFFPLLWCWVGVHCGIYKGSWNVSDISYLNSPPPPLSFILPPWFLERFQQVSFSHLRTRGHIFCTVFTLLPMSLPPCHLPPIHKCQLPLPPPQGIAVLPSCFLIL